jgi:hypothetical protein
VTPRRLLVVTTTEVEPTALQERIRGHAGGEAAEIKIVAPAADVSPLKWLANDDADARGGAEQIVSSAASAADAEGSVVETEVGDSDPVQAIEDALRTFPADEVVVITRAGEAANWLEADAGAAARERFGVPVTHLTA